MTASDFCHRAADIILGLVMLLCSLPLLIVMAVAVRLTMGRPVLFHQIRMGRHGVPFRLTKLRSMTDGRDAQGALLPDVRRTTPFGRFLRRSRLDELPELWLIVTGRMSLIGPRPLLPATLEAMGADGVRRGSVRPGLTGWAQVCGNSSLNNADKLTLDLWYIDNRSARLDFFILFRTVLLMLFGERIDHVRLERARLAQRQAGRS